jgi:hypothetical protein
VMVWDSEGHVCMCVCVEGNGEMVSFCLSIGVLSVSSNSSSNN